jgi:hypothetical protein
MTTIRQIMPATGWRAVYVTVRDDDGSVEVREEPVMCFALLDPPYVERNDGPEQPVVPMMQDVFPPEFVITDNDWWDNQSEQSERHLVAYLGPGEDQTLPWVQRRIKELSAKLNGD